MEKKMLIVNPNARITKIYNSNRSNISIPKVTSKLWDVGKDSVELLRKINKESIIHIKN